MAENLKGQKIQIAVADLIRKVEKARAKAVADHERKTAKFERDRAAFESRAVDALARALKNAEAGQLPGYDAEGVYRRGKYRPTLTINVPGTAPEDPGDLKTFGFDRDLGFLRSAVNDTLTVGLDDRWAEYL